jgi:Holliday junction resolvasome RuvABC endonuclease subunit
MTPLYFVGVDPSMNGTGVSIIDDTGAIVSSHRLAPPSKYRSKRTAVKRLDWIRDSFREVLEFHVPIQMAAIESGSFRSRGQVFSLGEVFGICRLTLADHDIPQFQLAPTQVKKFLTNRGHADKNEVLARAEEASSITGLTDDEADAYCLARAARLVYFFNKKEPTACMVVRSNAWLKKLLTSVVIHQP